MYIIYTVYNHILDICILLYNKMLYTTIVILLLLLFNLVESFHPIQEPR